MAANDHRIETLEAKVEAQRAARDDQLSALAADLSGITEATRAVKSGVDGVEGRLRLVENRPQPGVLSFIAPAVSAVMVAGGLSQFILTQQQHAVDIQIAHIEQEQRANVLLAEKIRTVQSDEAIKQADINGYARAKNETEDQRLDRLEAHLLKKD